MTFTTGRQVEFDVRVNGTITSRQGKIVKIDGKTAWVKVDHHAHQVFLSQLRPASVPDALPPSLARAVRRKQP